MTPLVALDAKAMPLMRDNVDTDAIIPSREMKSVSKKGLADGLFAGWRYVAPGSRVISSTNRNFEGRQGPGIRTHIASPETVAASAIAGRIADPRALVQ